MGVLQWLRLRRPHKWELPTLLDWFLTAPIQFLVTKLYLFFLWIRGRPFKPHPTHPIRVVCLSDTHDATMEIPDGDLLIHAGDMTNSGTAKDIQRQIDWLASQKHQYKVIVGGNHDRWFDPDARCDEDTGKNAEGGVSLNGVLLLQQAAVKLEFYGGERTITVWGSGDTPDDKERPDWAYSYTYGNGPFLLLIPHGIDILVTHTPPACHLDNGLGCLDLLHDVWRVRPKLHVFGHIHVCHGQRPVYWDQCQKAYEYLIQQESWWPPMLLDPLFYLPGTQNFEQLLKLFYFGTLATLWRWIMEGFSGGSGCLMVNAAMQYGNTGRARGSDSIQVVDI